MPCYLWKAANFVRELCLFWLNFRYFKFLLPLSLCAKEHAWFMSSKWITSHRNTFLTKFRNSWEHLRFSFVCVCVSRVWTSSFTTFHSVKFKIKSSICWWEVEAISHFRVKCNESAHQVQMVTTHKQIPINQAKHLRCL